MNLEVFEVQRSDFLSVGRLTAVNYDLLKEHGLLDFDVHQQESSRENDENRDWFFTFLVPSGSEADLIHMVRVSMHTAQVECSCKAGVHIRTYRSPYRREKVGQEVEIRAAKRGEQLAALVTRPPSRNCPHIRKARAWLVRHGHLPQLLKEEERQLVEFSLPHRKVS